MILCNNRSDLKWVIAILGLMCLFYAIPSWSFGLERFKLDPVQATPDFVFYDQEGGQVGLNQFKGKTIILNFWATWCAPCLEEMPSMNRLQARYPDQLMILPISLDQNGAPKVADFYRRANIQHLPVYLDESQSSQELFGLRAFPTSIIINPEGLMVAKIEGQLDWDAKEVTEFLGVRQ